MNYTSYLPFILIVYFGLLIWIAKLTSKDQSNESFFIGKRSSNWFLVAFGMIGTSLSGVTFISVPGTVASQSFYYFQVVIGYFLGYIAVAYILLPVYYSLGVQSIYHFLKHKLGVPAYKTGATFFILSRTLGATARLFLVINVLQLFLLNDLGISFEWTAVCILCMIIIYTIQGGVKTIVWTDTLQTFFMLLGLFVCTWMILNALDLNLSSAIASMNDRNYLEVFNTDVNSSSNFIKHIIGGALISISMTGMDQEMMQKNISVKTLKDSQKNMMVFSIILVFINLVFLFLGGLLYLFAEARGITTQGDDLFPLIAIQHMPVAFSILFIIGLISALFPSADGAITALTSSFCIDILNFNQREDLNEEQKIALRKKVHYSFAVIFLILVFVFKWIDNKSIIYVILTLAGYTYGPLMGLFAFALVSKRKLADNYLVMLVCLVAPGISYLIEYFFKIGYDGFSFGFLNLGLNALLTYLGLYFISSKST